MIFLRDETRRKNLPTFHLFIRNPSLLKDALILSKSLDSQGTYSWFTFVKNITSDQNIFDKTSNCKNVKEVKSLKPFTKRELKNKYKQM